MSPLDWALVETWKNAGVPLEAALRGIDAAFEKWRTKKSAAKTVNSRGVLRAGCHGRSSGHGRRRAGAGVEGIGGAFQRWNIWSNTCATTPGKLRSSRFR